MGDHHKLKYKSKTDTDLFRTRVKEENQQLALKHQSSEAQLKTVNNDQQPFHRAHGSCLFHVTFFDHKPLPKFLRQAQTNLVDVPKNIELVRLRHNEGRPSLFNSFARPVCQDGQPSLPQLKSIRPT